MFKTFWRESLTKEQAKRWDEYVARNETGDYAQLSIWGVLNDKEYKPRYFWIERDEAIVGVGLVQVARTAIPNKMNLRVQSGPVCDDVDLLPYVLDELARTCARHGGMRLEVNPHYRLETGIENLLSKRGFTPVPGCDTPTTLWVDLTRAPEEIFGSFRQTTRHEIKKFSRLGGEIRAATTIEDWNDFLTIFQTNSYYHSYPLRPENALMLWQSWFGESTTGILLLAYYDDKPTAGVAVLKLGQKALYLWGTCLKHRRGMPQTHGLVWQAMLWAKEHGCTQFDLGGWWRLMNTTHLARGVFLFKAGFSHDVVEFCRPHRRILTPVSYRVWLGLSQVKEKIQRQPDKHAPAKTLDSLE